MHVLAGNILQLSAQPFPSGYIVAGVADGQGCVLHLLPASLQSSQLTDVLEGDFDLSVLTSLFWLADDGMV